jgi:hypothetical protein
LGLSDWEKFLERRKANIGFITRGKAFRDPSDGEKAAALAHETKMWQESQGKLNYKISAPYNIAKGKGINLLATREFEEPIKGPERERAIDAYMNTPMDPKGILKSIGIDVEPYRWREIGPIKAFWSWITGRKVRRKYD